tara:strand:+ start:550 stop:1674 length:1125 start_codon:yes stop_codon:yes gene_type:complete
MESFIENLRIIIGESSLNTLSLQNVGYAVGILFLFLIFRKFFSSCIINVLKKITEKTKTEVDDKIVQSIEEPLRFFFLIIGLFAAITYLPLEQETNQFLDSAIKTLITVNIFWLIYKLIEPLSFGFKRLSKAFGSSLADDLEHFFVRSTKIIIFFLGTMTILQQWGINIIAFVGGLGLAGAAVALAAKDTVSNLFGGLTIFADKTFKKGDRIETDFCEGFVESVGLRATKIRSLSRAIITIPNAKLTDTAVINWSQMTSRRVKMVLGLEYRTTSMQLRKIVKKLRTYLSGHKKINNKELQGVHLVNFGDSSIDIDLHYFTEPTDYLEWRNVVHQNMLDFKSIIESENASFAFPSVSMYVEKMNEENIKLGRKKS